VVMDVIGNLPIFIVLTEKVDQAGRRLIARKAVLVSGLLMVVFLLFGEHLLGFFAVSISSFKAAGGIVLLLIGIELVLGLDLMEKRSEKYEVAVIPMATPLLAGPAVITTLILLVHQFGFWITLAGGLGNVLIAWLVLGRAELLIKLIGRQGCEVISRLFGIFIVAIAVGYIKHGWLGM